MKVSEIQVGKTYTNGKGVIRKITAFSQNPYYLYFTTIEGFSGHGHFIVLKTSFARWAKAEVTDES